MSPLDHYREAERLLDVAGSEPLGSTIHKAATLQAIGHGVLAVAAQLVPGVNR